MRKIYKVFIIAIFMLIVFTLKNCTYATSISQENYEKIINGEIELTYGLFGAKGDGKTNDFEAIRATHEFANEIYSSKNINLTVYGESSKTYYMGVGKNGESIPVQTNTDWKNCNFIIDDYIDEDGDGTNDITIGNPVFDIISSKSKLAKTLKQIKQVQIGYKQTDFYINQLTKKAEWLADYLLNEGIGSYGFKKLYVIIENKNKKNYRSGTTEYDVIENFIINMQDEGFGEILSSINNEIISEDDFKDGKMSNVKITIFPMDEDEITVQNGSFLTHTNNYVYDNNGNKAGYTRRGIRVYARNNTVVNNIVHTINEQTHLNTSTYQDNKNGNLYDGFLICYNATNVTFKNCKLMAHTKTSGGGTYDINLGRSININLENIGYSCVCSNRNTNKQATVYCENCYEDNMLDNKTRWGIMGNNYIKNFNVYNCKLNRIDSHQGVWGMCLKDSTIGVNGLTLNGGGNCLVSNITFDSTANIVTLRSDYGANWNGEIKLKDIKWIIKKDETNPHIIQAKNPGNLNYGYDCHFPKLEVYNMTIDNSQNVGQDTRIYMIYLLAPATTVTHPYEFLDNINIKNINNINNKNSEFYLWLTQLWSSESGTYTDRFLLNRYKNTKPINFKIQNVHNFGYNSISDKEGDAIKKYNNISNSIFNVVKILQGDSDEDSQITAYDAYKALEYSIEDNVEDEKIYLLDMDEDNMISSYDAYTILKESIGI